jgi:hypothetical protein
VSRRRYLYRVTRKDGDGWVPVRHYQSPTAARHRANVLALASHGATFRIERSDPITFDPTPAVYTLAYYLEPVSS